MQWKISRGENYEIYVFTMSKCLFADAVLICSSWEDMVVDTKIYDKVSAGWGLTLSVSKIKSLVVVLGCLLLICPSAVE